MLIFLLIQQLIFFAFAWAYPPYKVSWNNTVMLITQCLYIFLDIAFLVNVTAKMGEETRYFYVGFSMIAIVLFIILANICIGTFFQTRELYRSCAKKMKKAQTAPAPSLVVQAKEPEKDSLALKESRLGEAIDESAAPISQGLSPQLPKDLVVPKAINLAETVVLAPKSNKPKASGEQGVVLKRKPQIKHRSKPQTAGGQKGGSQPAV